MHVIRVRNVHEALPEAVHYLKTNGREVTSRNGTTIRATQAVTTVYENPRERVLFWPARDANPWFHFYEALWMLNGQQDVAPLTRFVKTMSNFSDDGITFHGAYGHRWRQHFGLDQIWHVARALKADPENRRQVVGIWDPTTDLDEQVGKRDIPCNLAVLFSMEMNALDIMVPNRSNDIVWGCYGANAVHFSMLQEVMAAMVGCAVGRYTQVSNNWHAYPETFKKVEGLDQYRSHPAYAGQYVPNPYHEHVKPFRVVNVDPERWFQDLAMFMVDEGSVSGYRDVFFRRVAVPMMRAHDILKSLDPPHCYVGAIAACEDIAATDWRMACEQWLQRRLAKWEAR